MGPLGQILTITASPPDLVAGNSSIDFTALDELRINFWVLLLDLSISVSTTCKNLQRFGLFSVNRVFTNFS